MKVLPFGKDLGWASICTAQGTWVQMANFGGGKRVYAAGFSIGTIGYIGTGDTSGYLGITGAQKDFWAWDQSTNIWTQKADFWGGERY